MIDKRFKFDIAYYRQKKIFVWTLSYIAPENQKPTVLQFQMGSSQIGEILRRLQILYDESQKE